LFPKLGISKKIPNPFKGKNLIDVQQIKNERKKINKKKVFSLVVSDFMD